MDVQLAVLADAANVSDDRKLNLLGVFDRLVSDSFPLRHPCCALAVRVRLGYDDSERSHELAVELRDEDMRRLLRIPLQLQVGRIAAGGWSSQNYVFTIRDLTLKRAGHYAFHVCWNGQDTARADLMVEQAVPEPRPGA